MTAKDFHDKRLKEDETIGTIQLMEEYAKHIIEIKFCNGYPIEFNELTIAQLKNMNETVNSSIDWVNSI